MEIGRYLTAEQFFGMLYGQNQNDGLAQYVNNLHNYGYPLNFPEKEKWIDIYNEIQSIERGFGNKRDWKANPVGFFNGFNTVERVLSLIDNQADWVNPYSTPQHVFNNTNNGILYPYVKRWFDWYNYFEKLYNHDEEKQEYLYTIEDGVETKLFDKTNQPITTKEGYLNITKTRGVL